MADQLSCTCGDVYGGFPRNGEEPTSNQYDSTCPIHGNYKELDRRKPSNQPSKESLERAVSVVAGLRNQLFGTGLDSVKIQHDIVQAFALEFDAILKNHEQDCDYIRGFNAGRRELYQQNVALVDALRELEQRWRIAIYNYHSFAGAGVIACADELNAVLASYAPAEEKEKLL